MELYSFCQVWILCLFIIEELDIEEAFLRVAALQIQHKAMLGANFYHVILLRLLLSGQYPIY